MYTFALGTIELGLQKSSGVLACFVESDTLEISCTACGRCRFAGAKGIVLWLPDGNQRG